MVDPLKKLNLDKKLGPLDRKAWIGIGIVGIVGILYYRSRQASDVANTGDATVAGATQDPATGDLQNTDGSDDGSTPSDFYDSTDDGLGLGSDALLGAGGIVAALPVGQDGTDSGSGIVTATATGNPVAPGAAASAPINLPSAPSMAPTVNTTYNQTTVEAPAPAAIATHVTAVKKAISDVKNGKKPAAPKKVTKPKPKTVTHKQPAKRVGP